MACRQLPSFSPIQDSVQREQFRCYKSPKGERGGERLTGRTVAEGDLQNPANVFFSSILRGHPASLTWAIPTSLFFLLNFPFSSGSLFSGTLCLVARFVPHFLHILFFFLFVPPMRQLNLSYSVNLSCSFTAFLFAVAYPFLFAFPPLCQLTPLSFSPSLFSFSPNPPPPLPWLYPSLSAISLVRGHFAAPVFQSPLLALGSERPGQCVRRGSCV